MGDLAFGISQEMLAYVAGEIQSIYDLGVELAVVVAGEISSGAFQPALMAWNEPRQIIWACWQPS